MATFKRCSNCHQLFTGKECPVCRAKMAAAYQKRRLCMNESTRRYHSRVWQRCRKAVILKYSGYDVWLLGIGIWEKCDPAYVHHIAERDAAPDRFFDEDNLIPVEHASHEEIHVWYNNGRRNEALVRIQKGKEVYEKRFGHEYRRRSETSAHPP